MTAAASQNGQGRARGIALVVIVLTLLVDQTSKYWVLNHTALPDGERISLLPVFDLVLTWNMGISYGLFPQHGDLGRYVLIGVTLAAIAALSVWMWRSTERMLSTLGLALIVGGAVGNLIDRLVFGGVVDFLYLHYGSFSWYVFNLADSAIVAGVGGLLYDSLRPRPQ